MGAVLELPAKLHCQFSPFWPFFAVNGLDWQCCFAGSSKTAPRILIFSIAMGADYSFELNSIETSAYPPPKFLDIHINLFLGTVESNLWWSLLKMHCKRKRSKAEWASENVLCIPQSPSSCINLLSWPDTYAIPKVYQI